MDKDLFSAAYKNYSMALLYVYVFGTHFDQYDLYP